MLYEASSSIYHEIKYSVTLLLYLKSNYILLIWMLIKTMKNKFMKNT